MFMYCGHSVYVYIYRYIQVYTGIYRLCKGHVQRVKDSRISQAPSHTRCATWGASFCWAKFWERHLWKKTLRSMRRNMKKSMDFDSTLIHLPRYVLTRAASNFGGLLASPVLTAVLAQCLVEVRRMVAFYITGCHTLQSAGLGLPRWRENNDLRISSSLSF